MWGSEYYYCTVKRTSDTLQCVVSYPDSSTNALAFVSTGKDLARLQHAGPWDNGLMLDRPMPIRIREQEQLAAARGSDQAPMTEGCWDAYAGCLFAIVGHAVVRISEDGEGTVVAGRLTERGKADGLGHAARFGHCGDIFSDGEGCLYLLDDGLLRLLKLPAAWRSKPVNAPGAAAVSSPETNQPRHQQQTQRQQEQGREQEQQQQQRGVLPARWPEEAAVQVTTVKCGSLDGKLRRGAYDSLTCSLVLSSGSRVYRQHMAGGLLAGPEAGAAAAGAAAAGAVAGPAAGAAAAAADGAAVGAAAPAAGPGAGSVVGATAPHEPMLVADLKEVPNPYIVEVHGESGYQEVAGFAVDGMGAIWVAVHDFDDDGGLVPGTQLHRVDPSGSTSRVAEGCSPLQRQSYASPTILQDGSLAMVSADRGNHVLMLHLNLRPLPPVRKACPNPCPGPSSSSSSPGSQTHSLSSDLGALLGRQPDGSADVEVEVGGQAFAAHRSVLAARSPYFRQRLDPGAGFADGEGPRLSLPDADPSAFAAVLRYMYTDSAGPVPPELLQPVGELADRLLLPGLCAHVGQQLLWQVRPGNVVGLLLWADRRKGSFGALLSGLKEWFLGHHAKGEGGWVLSDDEVLRLMQGKHVAMELLYHQRPDVRGCKRQRGW